MELEKYFVFNSNIWTNQQILVIFTNLVAVEQVQEQLQEREDKKCTNNSPEVPESSLVTLHLLLSWSNCVQ